MYVWIICHFHCSKWFPVLVKALVEFNLSILYSFRTLVRFLPCSKFDWTSILLSACLLINETCGHRRISLSVDKLHRSIQFDFFLSLQLIDKCLVGYPGLPNDSVFGDVLSERSCSLDWIDSVHQISKYPVRNFFCSSEANVQQVGHSLPEGPYRLTYAVQCAHGISLREDVALTVSSFSYLLVKPFRPLLPRVVCKDLFYKIVTAQLRIHQGYFLPEFRFVLHQRDYVAPGS